MNNELFYNIYYFQPDILIMKMILDFVGDEIGSGDGEMKYVKQPTYIKTYEYIVCFTRGIILHF